MLGCRSVSQFFILAVGPIQDIEAQHPEVRRQPTEMGVQNKNEIPAVAAAETAEGMYCEVEAG